MEKKSLGLIVVILLVFMALVYFLFFYTEGCASESCFNRNLVECSKASYVHEAKDASWKYDIEGGSGDRCEVEVTLLQMKRGGEELESLEGKEMNCYLPKGTVVIPENNLEMCHGLLKEELQTEIINKLHQYITDNLDQIEEGLKEPLS